MYYELTDIQACEPEALLAATVATPITIQITTEVDDTSAGCARVTIRARTRQQIIDFVKEQWGVEDGDWFSDYVVRRITEKEDNLHRTDTPIEEIRAISGRGIYYVTETLDDPSLNPCWVGVADDPVDALDRYSLSQGFATYSHSEMASEVDAWAEEASPRGSGIDSGDLGGAYAPFTNTTIYSGYLGPEEVWQGGGIAPEPGEFLPVDVDECQAIRDRKVVTRGIAAAIGGPTTAQARIDALGEEYGTEKGMMALFSVLHGIVAEYQDGGDQMVELCSCGQHYGMPESVPPPEGERVDIPEGVDVDAIAEDAFQAAFALICSRLEVATGQHIWGDMDPMETHATANLFKGFVRTMIPNLDAQLPARKRDKMVAIFDVTDLTEEERGHLGFAVTVQTESDRDNDFPGSPSPDIYFAVREVAEAVGMGGVMEEKPADRTILVHANLTVSSGADPWPVEDIVAAVDGALQVGLEGAPIPKVDAILNVEVTGEEI